MKKEINITRAQFFEFIRSKNETEDSSSPQHFLAYFDQYQTTGKKAGWNFASLFFMHSWFFFRRMYLYGFVVGMCSLIPDLLFEYYSSEGVLKYILVAWLVLIEILVMRYADYLYLQFANHEISKGHLNNGPNWVSGIVACFLCAVSTEFIFWLFYYFSYLLKIKNLRVQEVNNNR
jgi:hypothetical protein